MAANLNCPVCGTPENTVTTSRPTKNGIRRRRQCNACGHRWTTYEFSVEDWMEAVNQREKEETGQDADSLNQA